MSWESVNASCNATEQTGLETVIAGAISHTIVLSQSSASFVINVIPNWNTTTWIISQSSSAVVVGFGTPVPVGGGTLRWNLEPIS